MFSLQSLKYPETIFISKLCQVFLLYYFFLLFFLLSLLSSFTSSLSLFSLFSFSLFIYLFILPPPPPFSDTGSYPASIQTHQKSSICVDSLRAPGFMFCLYFQGCCQHPLMVHWTFFSRWSLMMFSHTWVPGNLYTLLSHVKHSKETVYQRIIVNYINIF